MLPHPDDVHLREAEGWFELGNLSEAVMALMKASLEFHMQPEFLKVKCSIAQGRGEAKAIMRRFEQSHLNSSASIIGAGKTEPNTIQTPT